MSIIQVIKQCGLERDLTLFEAKDLTEVGEKGLTLRCVRRQQHNDDCELMNPILIIVAAAKRYI